MTTSLRTQIFLAPQKSSSPSASLCRRAIDPAASAQAVLAADVELGLKACAEEFNEQPNDPALGARLKAAKEQRAFKNSMNSTSADASETYLLLYPSGRYADAVRDRLALITPPPQRAPVVVAPPPPQPPRDYAAATRTLLERYWANVNDQAKDGAAIAPYYGDSVMFYGGRKSKGDVIGLKTAYFKDWNVRDYKSPDVHVHCEAALCTEEGTVEWRVVSQSRRVNLRAARSSLLPSIGRAAKERSSSKPARRSKGKRTSSERAPDNDPRRSRKG